MLSSEEEDKLLERDAIVSQIRAEYEEDLIRYRSIVNSFFETYKQYGFVSPDNNIELRTMVMLNHPL